MGLFGDNEERLKKKQQKEEKELNEFVNKYGLETLSTDDLKILRRISADLNLNGFFRMQMAFSSNKEEHVKISCLSALVEQNWLIIKQLGSLNNKLNILIEKNVE